MLKFRRNSNPANSHFVQSFKSDVFFVSIFSRKPQIWIFKNYDWICKESLLSELTIPISSNLFPPSSGYQRKIPRAQGANGFHGEPQNDGTDHLRARPNSFRQPSRRCWFWSSPNPALLMSLSFAGLDDNQADGRFHLLPWLPASSFPARALLFALGFEANLRCWCWKAHCFLLCSVKLRLLFLQISPNTLSRMHYIRGFFQVLKCALKRGWLLSTLRFGVNLEFCCMSSSLSCSCLDLQPRREISLFWECVKTCP